MKYIIASLFVTTLVTQQANAAVVSWYGGKHHGRTTASGEKFNQHALTAASNVHKADVERLRAKEEDATVEINDITFGDDGVSATASITVRNFLQMDSIGQEAHLVDEAEFQLPMSMENNAWKIRMVNLPRSGKRSRD